jgi:ABC-type transport system substrate-binding protein
MTAARTREDAPMLRRSVIAAALAVAIMSVACTHGNDTTNTQGGSPGAATVKEGGVLRLAAFDGIDSLNPFVGVNDDSYSAYMYLYPYLVQYDSNLEFAPDFATGG